jgi:hypothetical protein
MHRPQFRNDLIVGDGKKVGELQEGYRAPSRQGFSDADTDNGGFGQWRVLYPARIGGGKAFGQPEHVSLGILEIFAEKSNLFVLRHSFSQDFADRLEHDQIVLTGGRRGASIFRRGVLEH